MIGYRRQVMAGRVLSPTISPRVYDYTHARSRNYRRYVFDVIYRVNRIDDDLGRFLCMCIILLY